MLKRFSDKVILVTGGCRGIGKSIVERFAGEGAKVYALDYAIPQDGEPLFDDQSLNEFVKCVKLDVTQSNEVTSVFESIVKEAGKIDILVNNAGITKDNLIMRLSEQDWDAVLTVNLKGAFLCCKTVARTMMSQRSGRIINIGSVVGSTGNAGQVNYSASKAGLIGMTKSLAKELGSRNILVNLVAPGYVITPMTEKLTEEQKNQFLNNIPLKRGSEPKEIASVVAFLASEDSSYITGEIIHVNGGLAM